MAMVNKNYSEDLYLVIHPLEDEPEAKHNPDNLGPMPMSRSVRFSLIALRTYLIVMGLMLLYRFAAQMHLLQKLH